MAKRSGSDLKKYREKRDPGRTNEPFEADRPSVAPGRGGPTRSGAFVCHLHDASRRHYDLRLEVAGALKSFAVPKGPTLDPKVKRLAVQTEDHPLSYLDFEDVIPDGNYGAGSMITWDRGRVRYLETTAEEGVESGNLKFELYGYKLRGSFALVKTSGRREKEKPNEQPQWLLIKKTDAFATPGRDVTVEEPLSVLSGLTVDDLERAAEIAAEVEAEAAELGAPKKAIDARKLHPMLCSLEAVDLEAPDWLYELKLDGVRIVADKHDDEVALFYRTSRSATAAYPEIARAVRALAPKRIVLDGEIVAFDDVGRPDFQKLARRIHVTRPSDVQFAMLAVPVVYLVFDLLAIGDRDLRKLPLTARKELLAKVVAGKGLVRRLDHIEGRGAALLEFCRSQSLEGIVAKKATSKYREGPKRFPEWVKVKCERDAEFVVVGYTVGTGGRKRLGALDVASYDDDGELVVRGKVGSGLSEEVIDALLPELKRLTVDEPCAGGEWGTAQRGRSYVAPQIVVTVRYLGWSDSGTLRFPTFKQVRDDVEPEQCRTHPRVADDAVLALPEAKKVDRQDSRLAGKRRVPLTNQNKVFWPSEGYTKGDLCEYYDAIAPAVLPHLKDRPVMLVRYPDGIEGKSFYQWRIPKGTPSWVRAFPVRVEEQDGKNVTTFIVDDVDTLLYIANLGCIPIHVLAGRVDSLDRCDFLTVDFDLGEAELRQGVELARELENVLDEIGLVGYPKTSGQRGLHVFVPLGPGVVYPTAKMLCELLGRIVQARHDDIGTMERVKERRGPRVYIDTGQTGRSRTIVAPYSVRAYPGASVSTPLHWDEVGFALDPRRYTMFTVPDRYAEIGDPMRGLWDDTPDIEGAVAALAKLLPRAD